MTTDSNDSNDSNSKKSVLGVHFGTSVKNMAGKYKFRDIIPENVQNALDANAKAVWVTMNHKNATISVRDNGDGVSIDQFNAASGQKGKTYKQDDNSVGQFNEGFLSPLGKCEYFTFTSKSKDSDSSEPYYRWTLVTEDIFESDVPVELNSEPIEYKFARNRPKSDSSQSVPWRSEMMMYNFKTTAPFDAHEILLECTRKYRVKMLSIDATLHLTVIDRSGKRTMNEFKAQKFAGKKLKVWNKVDGENETRIELYHSIATDKSNPGVRVSALKRQYDLPVSTLLSQETCLAVLHQDKDLISALNSNIFQGKIESNLLVLKSTRDGFEEDERLLEFLEHLEAWWNEVGRTEFAKLQNNESLEIFYNCAKKAQDAFKKLTEDPELQKLMESLRRSKPAGINDGLIAEADKHGDSIVDNGSDGNFPNQDPKDKPKNPGGKPGGTPRGSLEEGNKPVTVSYKGLRIKESQELDSSTPWQIDLATLTVFVNIEHQYYSRCFDVTAGKKEKAITDYQKKVLFQALSLITSGSSPSDTEWLAAQHVLFQELFLEVLTITGVSR